MRRTLLLPLAIATLASPAAAQVSGYDLSIAYCLGVFERREKEDPAGSLGEEAARQQAETVDTIYQYLKSRIGPNTPAPHRRALATFKDSGARDQSECTSGGEAGAGKTSAESDPCKRTAQCTLAREQQAREQAPAGRAAALPQQPVPLASLPQRQPVPGAVSSQPRPQQPPAPVAARSRPTAQAPAPQEGSQAAQTGPAGPCTVSRPQPGFQVYLVRCPSSWAMIGRTIDQPTAWTVSEGDNSGEAIEFFMKSRSPR